MNNDIFECSKSFKMDQRNKDNRADIKYTREAQIFKQTPFPVIFSCR
jgi:hypothetical protein